MKKIYIVIEDWAYEGAGEEAKLLKAFTTQEKAMEFLAEHWESLKTSDEELFEEFNEFEDYGTRKEAWKDNDYLMYHLCVWVEETKLID